MKEIIICIYILYSVLMLLYCTVVAGEEKVFKKGRREIESVNSKKESWKVRDKRGG